MALVQTFSMTIGSGHALMLRKHKEDIRQYPSMTRETIKYIQLSPPYEEAGPPQYIQIKVENTLVLGWIKLWEFITPKLKEIWWISQTSSPHIPTVPILRSETGTKEMWSITWQPTETTWFSKERTSKQITLVFKLSRTNG